jgi:hypothetical protein
MLIPDSDHMVNLNLVRCGGFDSGEWRNHVSTDDHWPAAGD